MIRALAMSMRGAALAACAAVCLAAAATADTVTVFAAASTRNALDEIAAGFEMATGHRVSVSYGGSSTLARQIQLGAPADIMLLASAEWMDALGNAIAPGTRSDLLSNRLVLVAGEADAPTLEIGPDLDLAALLGDGRLAMALIDAVPAGIYGKAALERLGLWQGVADRIAQTDNVRAALALVALREVPLGIVYATDAAAEPRVKTIATFPETSHPPIRYPVAAVAGRETAAGAAFLAHLRSDDARAAFARQGFIVLE